MNSNSSSSKGKIELIIGPMFSGKTTELIRRIDRDNVASIKTLIIKHKSDNRHKDNEIGTHSGQTYTKTNIIIADVLDDKLIGEIEKTEYKTVGIEEGQFFNDLYKFSNKLANNGVKIIISALNSTYKQEMFKSVIDVIPYADNMKMLTAVCVDCKLSGSSAAFTVRTFKSDSTILVGGSDKYKAVCRECLSKYDN